MPWSTGHDFAPARPDVIEAVGRLMKPRAPIRWYDHPEMPPEGLLFLPDLDFSRIPGDPQEKLSVITREELAKRFGEIPIYCCEPTDDSLRQFKRLAEYVGAPVATYFHETFGGVTDQEHAWVFGAREVVLFAGDGDWHATEVTAQSHQRLNVTVLMRVVELLGGRMRGQFFEPHLRNFDFKCLQKACAIRVLSQ